MRTTILLYAPEGSKITIKGNNIVIEGPKLTVYHWIEYAELIIEEIAYKFSVIYECTTVELNGITIRERPGASHFG